MMIIMITFMCEMHEMMWTYVCVVQYTQHTFLFEEQTNEHSLKQRKRNTVATTTKHSNGSRKKHTHTARQ